MSVLSPVVAVWDGENRRAYLAEGVSDFFPIEDIYHEYRNARKDDHELRKFAPLLRAEGNIPKGGGAYTPRYVVLLDGFKLIPFNESLQVNQLGDMITDDPDTDATLYDVSQLTVPKPIFIKPSEAETIQLNSESIVFSSFQGAVWVDTLSPYSDKGTATVPNGNTERPVDNIQLAVEIAVERGFDTIQVIGDLTLTAGDNVSGYHLQGTSHINSVLTVEDAALCIGTKYSSFDITGTLDGGSEIFDCVIRDLDYFNGFIRYSALAGTIVLSGNADALFDDCKMLDIHNAPVIDVGGSGQNLIMTNFSGRLIIANLTGASEVGVGLDAGEVEVSASCTAGTVSISGTGYVNDNSATSCYVVDNTVDGSELSNLQRIIEYMRPHHTGTGNVYFWDPYGGNDAHDGKHPDRAFKTFAHSHDMCENANHDTIMIVPGDPSGVTVITERVIVTKDYLFLRGPGRDVIFNVTNDHEDALRTEANGTEFSGFRIQHTTIDGHGVHTTGAFTLLENLWFEHCTNGAMIEGSHAIINRVKFYKPLGFGIRMQGTVNAAEISDVSIGGAGGNALEIDAAAGAGGIKMWDTVITGTTGYGVTLSTTTSKFVSRSGNVVLNNIAGDFNDLGTGNILNVEGSSTGGLDEGALHSGLDSYPNKDDWKADTVDVDAAAIAAEIFNTDIHAYNDPYTIGEVLHRIDYISAKVYVDTNANINGHGSQRMPFDNVNDAKDYAEENGIRDIIVSGSIVVPHNLKNMTIWGVGLPLIDFNGQDIKNTRISECILSGEYSSSVIAEKCVLSTGFELDGYFDTCVLMGEVLSKSNTAITLIDCLSGVPGLGRPSLNMSADNSVVGVRGWRGGLDVTDCSHSGSVITVGVAQGSLRFTDTCTAGEMVARGTCKFVDESNGVTVYDETSYKTNIAETVWLDTDVPTAEENADAVLGRVI